MERVALKIVCPKKSYEEIIGIHEMLLSYFTPTRIKLKNHKNNHFVTYNEKKVEKLLKDEMLKDDYEIYIKDINNSFRVMTGWSNRVVLISITLMEILVDDVLIKEIDNIFSQNGIVGLQHSLDDYVEQNGTSRKSKRNYQGCYEMNIEHNPGYFHVVDGIWFGSCYRMWFGKEFYQYISKEKLQSFANCYENCELENEVTRITLYENMWDYAKEENRQRQWDFRRSVGMDEVAHILEEEKTKRKVTDSEIEIQTGNFSHGGVRLINQYFDEEGNIVCKSKAKKVKIAEYSADGKIIFSEEKRL